MRSSRSNKTHASVLKSHREIFRGYSFDRRMDKQTDRPWWKHYLLHHFDVGGTKYVTMKHMTMQYNYAPNASQCLSVEYIGHILIEYILSQCWLLSKVNCTLICFVVVPWGEVIMLGFHDFTKNFICDLFLIYTAIDARLHFKDMCDGNGEVTCCCCCCCCCCCFYLTFVELIVRSYFHQVCKNVKGKVIWQFSMWYLPVYPYLVNYVDCI